MLIPECILHNKVNKMSDNVVRPESETHRRRRTKGKGSEVSKKQPE